MYLPTSESAMDWEVESVTGTGVWLPTS